MKFVTENETAVSEESLFLLCCERTEGKVQRAEPAIDPVFTEPGEEMISVIQVGCYSDLETYSQLACNVK